MKFILCFVLLLTSLLSTSSDKLNHEDKDPSDENLESSGRKIESQAESSEAVATARFMQASDVPDQSNDTSNPADKLRLLQEKVRAAAAIANQQKVLEKQVDENFKASELVMNVTRPRPPPTPKSKKKTADNEVESEDEGSEPQTPVPKKKKKTTKKPKSGSSPQGRKNVNNNNNYNPGLLGALLG